MENNEPRIGLALFAYRDVLPMTMRSLIRDLTQHPEIRFVWAGNDALIDRTRSERAACLGPGCRHAKQCPMRVARALARNADIIVSKHRHGPTGTVQLFFRRQLAQFVDAEVYHRSLEF